MFPLNASLANDWLMQVHKASQQGRSPRPPPSVTNLNSMVMQQEAASATNKTFIDSEIARAFLNAFVYF